MFKQVLLHEAQRNGRLPSHHRACAHTLCQNPEILQAHHPSMANHLLSSGQLSAALPHLREGAHHLLREKRIAEARRLLRQHAAALSICPQQDNDEEIQADIVRSQIDVYEGRFGNARNLLLWSLGRARAVPVPLLIARIRLELAQVALKQKRPLTAWRHAIRCGQQLEQCANSVLIDQHASVVQRILAQSFIPFPENTPYTTSNQAPPNHTIQLRTND